MESSAKERINVDEAFQSSADMIYEKIKKGQIDIDNDGYGVKQVNIKYGDMRLKNKEGLQVQNEGNCANC